jgi:hypothetical protein
MLPTFIGLVIFSVGFVFSVSNTKYHILCSGVGEHIEGGKTFDACNQYGGCPQGNASGGWTIGYSIL